MKQCGDLRWWRRTNNLKAKLCVQRKEAQGAASHISWIILFVPAAVVAHDGLTSVIQIASWLEGARQYAEERYCAAGIATQLINLVEGCSIESWSSRPEEVKRFS